MLVLYIVIKFCSYIFPVDLTNFKVGGMKRVRFTRVFVSCMSHPISATGPAPPLCSNWLNKSELPSWGDALGLIFILQKQKESMTRKNYSNSSYFSLPFRSLLSELLVLFLAHPGRERERERERERIGGATSKSEREREKDGGWKEARRTVHLH